MYQLSQFSLAWEYWCKGTVMYIEKVLINDRLGVSKLPWKFCISTINKFAVI